MKPAISNMWVTVQGISRTTNQTILGLGRQYLPPSTVVFEGDALAYLRHFGVIGPQLQGAIASSKLPLEEIVPTYVNLAFAEDCLRIILQPVGVYFENGGNWSTLNLSPLMAVLKPVAQSYSSAFTIYRPFGSLTKRNVIDFIDVYMRKDKGFFSYNFEETRHLSIKLCRLASIMLCDESLLNGYLDGVLTTLFNKSAQQTGTQREVSNLWTEHQAFFDSMRINTGARPPKEPEASANVTATVGQEIAKVSAVVAAPVGTEVQAPPAALDEALKELDALIGIPRVKDEVKKLAAFLSIRKEREKHGLPTRSRTLHFVFTGNPGTGKTTVARIVAKILHGFELLKTPKLVETARSNLVAGYVGQTAIKTDEVINSALDGVLFIDEAYTLSDGNDQDSFGKEAISTLLKRMEDNRDRLSVIVAGYPKLMEGFLKSNPGLGSRFTRTIHFDDYSVSELGRIFLEYCKQAKYEMDTSCLALLSIVLAKAFAQRDEHFGNARFVRNLFEEVQMRYSQRLFANARGEIAKAELVRLDPSDFLVGPLNGVPLAAIPLDSMKWSSVCAGCKAKYTGNMRHFGRTIPCRRCKAVVAFDCWDPTQEDFK